MLCPHITLPVPVCTNWQTTILLKLASLLPEVVSLVSNQDTAVTIFARE